MALATLTEFFQWATIIGMALYIWTAIMSVCAPDFMYKFHNKWFSLSRETFNVAIYCFLAVFKIMLIIFILVPYLALLAMS